MNYSLDNHGQNLNLGQEKFSNDKWRGGRIFQERIKESLLQKSWVFYYRNSATPLLHLAEFFNSKIPIF